MSTFTDPPNGGNAVIRPPLRLVHPAPPKPPKTRHQRGATFTADEVSRLRAVLRNARAMFGTWGRAAIALRVPEGALRKAANTRPVSADLAVRLARALGKPLEALIRPPSDASTCPTCGRRS